MYSLYYLENINWQNVAYLQNNYVCCGNNGDIGKNFLMNNGIVKNAVCLGNYGSVDFDNSVAIGAGASCNAPNQIALGAPGTTVRVFDSIISQY